MKIGELLINVRSKKQLTQEALVNKVGEKKSYFSKIETNSSYNINLQTIIDIVEKGLDGEVNLNLKF